MISIPEFDLTERLNESEHSIVYSAKRQNDNQPVILKILKNEFPQSEELARFRWEYRLIHSLNLEGTIKAFDLLELKNTLVMVLEDFGGKSLAKTLSSRKLDLIEVLNFEKHT